MAQPFTIRREHSQESQIVKPIHLQKIEKRLSQPLHSKLNKNFHIGLSEASSKYREYPRIIRGFVLFLTYILEIASYAFNIVMLALRVAYTALDVVNWFSTKIISILTNYSTELRKHRVQNLKLDTLTLAEILQAKELHDFRKAMRTQTVEDTTLNILFSTSAQQAIETTEAAYRAAQVNIAAAGVPMTSLLETAINKLPLGIIETFNLVNKAFFKSITAPLPKNVIYAAASLIARVIKLGFWLPMLVVNTGLAALKLGVNQIAKAVTLTNDIFVLLPAILFSIPVHLRNLGRFIVKKKPKIEEDMLNSEKNEAEASTTNMLAKLGPRASAPTAQLAQGPATTTKLWSPANVEPKAKAEAVNYDSLKACVSQ